MHIILVVLICTLIANQHIHKIYLWLLAITIFCCHFFASGLCVTAPKWNWANLFLQPFGVGHFFSVWKKSDLKEVTAGSRKLIFGGGVPQIIHFNRVFHYKPSILGYPYFGNTHMLYIMFYWHFLSSQKYIAYLHLSTVRVGTHDVPFGGWCDVASCVFDEVGFWSGDDLRTPRNVVIPLGGIGSRFQTEGYLTRPKPFIPVLGRVDHGFFQGFGASNGYLQGLITATVICSAWTPCKSIQELQKKYLKLWKW